MSQGNRRAFVVLLGLAASLAVACGGGDKRAAPTGGVDNQGEGGVSEVREPNISTFSTRDWRTDFSRHTVSYSEVQSGGPPKDGIPAIDKPKFIGSSEADRFLGAEEPVMVVAVTGDARAYPLQIMLWHEIVNDTVGGEPIVVTYCPLCNTALAFHRTFEGQVLDFGTTGNLRHSDLVMYDRQSESWWQQITGEAIVGTHAGKKLMPFPTGILPYAEYKAAHPDGKVLSRDTGFVRSYGINPYEGYDTSSPFLFRGAVDGRLGAMERVVSVVISDDAVAYPFRVLEKGPAVNDTVGGKPVVIFYKKGTKSALDGYRIEDSRDVGAGVAFSRTIDGRELTFRAKDGQFFDTQTGSRWDLSGQAVAGALKGAQLEPLVHSNHFWFAWAVFRPGTKIYGL